MNKEDVAKEAAKQQAEERNLGEAAKKTKAIKPNKILIFNKEN